MKRFMKWMTESFAPRLDAITNNIWIASIQEAIMVAIPMIFIGSIITLISILQDFIPGMPDLTPITTFSFGLLGLFIAFLTPYTVMEKRRDTKSSAGGNDRHILIPHLNPS